MRELNLGTRKDYSKVRLIVMVEATTMDKINNLMQTIKPPKRFDGKVKKNFRSMLVEAIINSWLDSPDDLFVTKKRIRKK